jgi:nucleotidyltransferase/DNA polymerase involved in DNA repair
VVTVGERAILHVDMDAFYAAVEERENPALRGKPVVIGSEPQEGRGRGVVATANYAARRYGIGSAMPISEAWRRCPSAVYLRPRMRLYADVSRRVRAIFERFTDLIEPISIDEAFLDVTASRRLYGDGPAIAVHIKDVIRREEELTASIGCAASKFVAKIASDLDKPDGLVVVEAGGEADFLAPLPIGRLWGAGPKALERFRRLGCVTIGDAARLDRDVLVRGFGESMGDRFHRLSRGIDVRPVVPDHVRKSLGKETTFGEDVADRKIVERTLLDLADQVAASLRRKRLAGATVTVKLRWEGFETVTRQRTLREPVNTVEKIWPVARELFRGADRPRLRVRLVGVTLSALDRVESGQADFFVPRTGTDSRVAEAVDALTDRFGSGTVTRAALLKGDDEHREAEGARAAVRVTRAVPEDDPQ